MMLGVSTKVLSCGSVCAAVKLVGRERLRLQREGSTKKR